MSAIFGATVALAGDTAVVGAWGYDQSRGTAYVYTWDGVAWGMPQELVHAGVVGDQFGFSVAISGDLVAVGARHRHGPGPAAANAGSVYVFARTNGVWSFQTELTGSQTEGSDELGTSVSLSGNTLIAGAPYHTIAGNPKAGEAYVFELFKGVWSEQAELQASDEEANDSFGFSVAMAGSRAIVGSPFRSDPPLVSAGAAYLFEATGGVWTQSQKVVACAGATGDRLGFSVAIDGDLALAGARRNDDKGVDAGAAYLLARSGGAWVQQGKLLAVDGGDGDFFGWGLAVSGKTIWVGGPNKNAGSGRVYELVVP